MEIKSKILRMICMQHRHIFFTKRLASLEIELSAETEMQEKKLLR